jgi:hypothetical protein
VKEICAHLNL